LELKFELTESLFENLLNASAGELSADECSEVRSFVDVGEYGLALQTAIDIYFEEKKKPSKNVVTLIEKLALTMLMDSEEFLKKIDALKVG
jgi:hypothetical protein